MVAAEFRQRVFREPGVFTSKRLPPALIRVKDQVVLWQTQGGVKVGRLAESHYLLYSSGFERLRFSGAPEMSIGKDCGQKLPPILNFLRGNAKIGEVNATSGKLGGAGKWATF